MYTMSPYLPPLTSEFRGSSPKMLVDFLFLSFPMRTILYKNRMKNLQFGRTGWKRYWYLLKLLILSVGGFMQCFDHDRPPPLLESWQSWLPVNNKMSVHDIWLVNIYLLCCDWLREWMPVSDSKSRVSILIGTLIWPFGAVELNSQNDDQYIFRYSDCSTNGIKQKKNASSCFWCVV